MTKIWKKINKHLKRLSRSINTAKVLFVLKMICDNPQWRIHFTTDM